MSGTTADTTGTSATTGQGGTVGAGAKPAAAGDQGGGKPAEQGGSSTRTSALDGPGEGDKGTQTKPSGKEAGAGAPADGGKGTDAALEVKLPDGVEADPKVLDWYKSAAKEAGLNSESASKLAEGFLKFQQGAGDAAVEAWKQQGKDWFDDLKADPKFGGANLDANLAAFQAAVNRYGGKQLAADLRQYGVDNLPSLVRAFAEVGKAIREDTTAGARGSQVGAELTEAELNDARFPSSKGMGMGRG